MFLKFEEPTDFSKDVVWRLSVGEGVLRKDIFLATSKEGRALYDLMKINGKALDGAGAALYRRYKATGPITTEDVKALITEAKFREPQVNEPDPESGPVTCLACAKTFQPIVYKTKDGGLRGSFVEFKADRLESIEDAETRKDVAMVLEATTAVIFASGRRPANILVAAKCPVCIRSERKGREKVIVTYLPAGEIRDRALGHDSRISAAKRRNFINSLFGSKRKDGGNKPSSNREGRSGGGYQRRADDRPRSDFHGANFLKETAEALAKAETEGKLTGGLEQLASASNETLRSFGVEGSERAYDAVRTIARRAMERTEADAHAKKLAGNPTHLGEVAKGLEGLRDLKFPKKPAPRRRQEKTRQKLRD